MSLQLVCRADTVCSEEKIQQRFPKVCNGLGTLGEPYVIKLKPDVNPYTLFTARNVPIPQRNKVRDEPERMESMGVIDKVTAPIQWCTSMVVMPKSSGAVKICIDLRLFNESILGKSYSVPKVDETLAQLSRATIFSKVDANSGFWQIPQSEDSQQYNTFISHYCFKKLPFCVASEPELF